MKALVVDDSSVMRKVVTGGLARAGIEDVEQATNGEEAVEAVKAHDFGLVLLDWNMPVMTGIEALKEIRGNGYSMPIIMVTTEAEKARILEAIREGASNYIIKPFQPDEFVKKVKEVMAKASC